MNYARRELVYQTSTNCFPALQVVAIISEFLSKTYTLARLKKSLTKFPLLAIFNLRDIN